MGHGILEHRKPWWNPFRTQAGIKARPGGVLGPASESFWMRHQSEDQSTGIADTRNAAAGTVEIRILCVTESDLPGLLELIEHQV